MYFCDLMLKLHSAKEHFDHEPIVRTTRRICSVAKRDVVPGTCRPFRQLVQNALDVGWVAIIGDRFTIDVERCWWVLAVCGVGSGFVAEAHLRGGLWSGLHALPRGDESPVRRAMVC